MNESNGASRKMTYEELEARALMYESLAHDRARYIDLLHHRLDKIAQKEAYRDWMNEEKRQNEAEDFEAWYKARTEKYRRRVLL